MNQGTGAKITSMASQLTEFKSLVSQLKSFMEDINPTKSSEVVPNKQNEFKDQLSKFEWSQQSDISYNIQPVQDYEENNSYQSIQTTFNHNQNHDFPLVERVDNNWDIQKKSNLISWYEGIIAKENSAPSRRFDRWQERAEGMAFIIKQNSLVQ